MVMSFFKYGGTALGYFKAPKDSNPNLSPEEQARLARENARRKQEFSDPNYRKNKESIAQNLQDAKGREQLRAGAAQVGPAAQTSAAMVDRSQVGGRAQTFDQGYAQINRLQDRALGRGPSLAALEGANQRDRSLRSALAVAQANRGQNPALAMRNLSRQQTDMERGIAFDTQRARLAEQQAAEGQLAGALGQLGAQELGFRGQQIGLAGQDAAFRQQADLANAQLRQQANLQQAGFQQQTNMANLQSGIQNQQQIDAMTQFYENLGLTRDEAERRARMQAEAMNMQYEQSIRDEAAARAGATLTKTDYLSALSPMNSSSTMGAAGFGMISDENMKKNIEELSEGIGQSSSGLIPQLQAPTMEISSKPPLDLGNTNLQSSMLSKDQMSAGKQGFAPLGNAGASAGGGGAMGALGGLGGLMGGGSGDKEYISTAGRTGEAKKILDAHNKKMNNKMAIAQTMMKMFSDAQMKKKKKSLTEAMRSPEEDFMDALKGYVFEYKNPMHGEGKRVGVMAQDVEKSKMGKMMVKNTPEGKMIDMPQAVGATMAGLGELNKKVSMLEAMMKKKGK